MQQTKTTAEIKKFGYEIGDWFTAVINLKENLPNLAMFYNVTIEPPRQDERLIKDTSYPKFEFRASVVRSNGFNEIKFKTNGEAMKEFIDLKEAGIDEIGIVLFAIE